MRRCNDRNSSGRRRILKSSICFLLFLASLISLPLARSFQSFPSLETLFRSRLQQRPKRTNHKVGFPFGLASTPLLREIDSIQEIQEGSLILSKVESSLGCHDLRQPYFHKAVVLVLDHDDEFTQGVLLNRASDLILDGSDILYVDDDDEENSYTQASSTSWRVHFGGDIGGWDDENPQLLCLHGIDTEASRAVSDPIFEGNSGNSNVHITSHRGALSMVQAGEATPDMFYTFSGFCCWEPGQLEREVERGSWCLASFVQEEKEDNDTHPLMDLLKQYSWKNPHYKTQSGGLEFWERLMVDLGKTRVHNNDDDKNHPQPFSDMMVKEWATQRLAMASGNDDSFDGTSESKEQEPTSQIDDQDIFRVLKAASESDQLASGAVVRASSVTSYLLGGQLFHKSTILILQESSSAEVSIGVILNLVSNDVYTLVVDGKEYEFPIRYGGYSGKEEGKQNQDEQYFWFHNNQLLKENDFGLPVSFSSASPESTSQDFSCIYACDFAEVCKALELGLAQPDDFLLVQGFCAWEKQGSSGGLMGQILNGNLQDTKWFQKTPLERESLWKCLLDQKPPSSENDLQENLALSVKAWEQGAYEKAQENPHENRFVFGSNVTVSELADEALFVWMKLFLLGNAVYLPVEL